MKKINLKHKLICLLSAILLTFTFTVSNFNMASALDISQQSLEITGQSPTIVVHDSGIGYLSITPKLEMNRLGDFISYRLVIRNNDGKRYKIIGITDDNVNKSISLTYNYPTEMNTSDKSIDFTIEYVKINESPLKTVHVTITVVDEDDQSQDIPIIVPNTGFNTFMGSSSATVIAEVVVVYIIFAIVCFAVYTIVRRKKSEENKGASLKLPKIILALVLMFGLIPVAVIATEFDNLNFTIFLTETKFNGPYVITFDTDDGGTSIPPQIVNNGDKVIQPDDPTRDGYDFDGWVDENGDPYDFDIPVNGPVKISAKWMPKEYTITYDLDEGTAGTPANPSKYTIETAEITLSNPTKEYYDFTGWTGTDLNEPTMEVKIPQGSTGDREYTANWKEKEYTVTYNSDGGTEVASETKKYNETFTKPADPERTGYTFGGWFLGDATDPYDFETKVTKDITLKAVWEKKDYTITFNSNGGSNVPTQTVKYQETATKPTDPTKTKFEFVEWQLNGTAYDFSTPVEDNITLDAVWIELFTVTFNSDGGSSVASQTVKDGETVSEPVAPTKTGYDFVKWQLNDADYNFSMPVTSDITLKAIWETVEYNIAYDLDDGTETTANPISYNIETATFMLNNPEKTGFTFIGWTGSNGTTPQTNVTIDQGTTGDLNYTANWEIIDYDIEYDLNGGSVATTNPISYNVETATFTLNNPTRTGYDFDGWTGSNGATPQTTVTISQGTIGDLSYTANWTPTTYNISYDLDGGNDGGLNPATYNIESSDITLHVPTRTGYVFKGWTGSNGDTPEITVKITQGSTGDKNYTANWTELFTVTFDADGGSPTPSAQTIRDGETATEPTTEPEKTDYVFNYWMDSNGDEFDFTTPITGNITLTAKWQVGRSTLNFDGPTMVTKMKQIANPSITISDGYNYPDTVTKSFKRASEEQYNAIKDQLTSENIISTSSSLTAAYMWFDDTTGTMYYYTEAEKVEVTGSMAKMFSKYDNLTDLSGLADFDVSGVTNMDRLFQASKSLNNDSLKSLADWDTSSVKNMSWIFGAGNSSEGLQITSVQSLSGWDVSSVISFQQAFKNAVKLVSLDGMENWNVSSVGYDASIPSSNSSAADNLAFSQMFNGCTSLTDASAIVGWDITNAVNSALANGKTKRWAFDKMLQNAPALASQPAFTEVSGSWQITAGGGINAGTYNPY